MVFGLCRGAWPYKGPCTAGGKLAAEALRVLKKSIQHAGARKTRLGHRPLIPRYVYANNLRRFALSCFGCCKAAGRRRHDDEAGAAGWCGANGRRQTPRQAEGL